MSQEMEALYQARLRRFVTALNNRSRIGAGLAVRGGVHGALRGVHCQQLTQHYRTRSRR